MIYELRPYQSASRDAVLREWDQGHKKTLLVLPTGAGKTIVFSAIAEHQVKECDHRVLVLAHRDELLQQASDKIKAASGLDSAFEKAGCSCLGRPEHIVIGSMQSMSRAQRLDRFPSQYFDDIIVDEAHHCLSDSYQRVLTHFPNTNVLGVTATPDRGDMRNLGEYFDSEAYNYPLADAVRDGYLCPIRAQMIPLKIDMSKVKTVAGDYSADGVGDALEPYLEQIAEEMSYYCNNRKTLVFLPLISTSQKFCRILQNMGIRAAEVHGTSEDREEILADFETGRYDVLCNSMLLTEGWDCPAVDCIVVLRPTKIRSLYQQMVGRGMRLAPGKENLLLLDFLWLTIKHNLCRPSSLISKNSDIEQRIDDKVMSGPVDLIDAEEEAEQDVKADREAALANELEAQRHNKRKLVDPLQYAMSINESVLTDYTPTFKWETEKPTDKQLSWLKKMGIDTGNIDSRGYAQKLIGAMMERIDAHMATPKQVKTLERYGFVNVGEWSFDEANKMIGIIAGNGWKVPAWASTGRRTA